MTVAGEAGTPTPTLKVATSRQGPFTPSATFDLEANETQKLWRRAKNRANVKQQTMSLHHGGLILAYSVSYHRKSNDISEDVIIGDAGYGFKLKPRKHKIFKLKVTAGVTPLADCFAVHIDNDGSFPPGVDTVAVRPNGGTCT